MKKKILNVSVTTHNDFSDLTIQRENGPINGRYVGSYMSLQTWPIERQARRVLRMFRFLNAYTRHVMTGKVSDVR
jgi:hypothetical protein